MAHTGKFGPVAWRRDLRLNVNSYQSAFAKYWSWSLGAMTGTIGSLITHKRLEPFIDLGPDRPYNRWESPFKDIGGAMIKGAWEITSIDPFGPIYKAIIEIESADEGVLVRTNPAFFNPVSASALLIIGQDDCLQPDLLYVPSVGAFCSGRGMGWSELPEDS